MEAKKLYSGLTEEEITESRQKYGWNLLTPPPKRSVWSLFFDKFKDPIIKILLIALLLSVIVSLYQFFSGMESVSVFFEPGGIFIAVVLATVIGFILEHNASKKFDILNQVNNETPVKVLRSGYIHEITKKEVVVGDIVILEVGEEVPADGFLLEAVSLQMNESTLTGEPVISKTTCEEEFKQDATYPSNEVLKGTCVVDGHGVFQVTKVGDTTEYGKVYTGSQVENDTKTPLNIQLDKLGKVVTRLSYGIAGLVVVVRLFMYFTSNSSVDWIQSGDYILDTFMIAITLVVVSVPEGLPMSIVLSLALSMKRMLKNNNLVRKMHACETMGAVSVICTDKTGTLTQNQMQVFQNVFPALVNQQFKDDEISFLLKESIAVNSTAFLESCDGNIKVLGNPTEGALLLWLNEQGEDYYRLREQAEIIEQLTFSTEKKYMATIVQSPLLNKRVLYVKGAPEIVMGFCSDALTKDGIVSILSVEKEVKNSLLKFQNQAMRTLGFAYLILEDNKAYFENGRLIDYVNLTFLGITAISDPVRDDVPEAITACTNAGINVKIVTGDTSGTAIEICRQIGQWKESDNETNIITGVEFAALPDNELMQRLDNIKIICRARPMDKERLVKLLQRKNYVVAVTGDGTNDAPALNAAQVGLSMGDGTTVAKEASDITILNNSFHSITKAVMWGRSLYRNIQRFIIFQMTVNVVACLIVLFGAFLGTESPLTVTQMLWVNLIMDTFAALALASLPPDEKEMKEKPRKPKDFIIIHPMMLSIVGKGLFFVFLLFGLLQYFKYEDISSLSDFNPGDFFHDILRFTPVEQALSPYELAIFFTTFVMLQFWNMFNVKAFATSRISLWRVKESKVFWGVALVILIGQILIVEFGGQMFNVQPLPLCDWLFIIIFTSIIFLVEELYRITKTVLGQM